MALYLTNIAAMHNMRSLSSINAGLDTVYKRLSSGKRINSAKDDPAGLQIADRLTSQINGYKQGSRNLSDGLALAQTMEGALDETTDMLQKIRTLAVQAANGTYDDASRAAINSQVQQLCQEITRIGKKTTFGGTAILDSNQGGFYSNGGIQIQASGMANDTITIPGFQNGFTMSGLSSYTGNDGKGSVVKDGDSLRFSLSTAENAQEVLGYIDEYIKAVSSYKGTLGGVQNRFESAIRLNDTMRENLSDARSRIQDTDYAEEAANLAELMVRQQVCASIMKQINNSKSIILSLLGG